MTSTYLSLLYNELAFIPNNGALNILYEGIAKNVNIIVPTFDSIIILGLHKTKTNLKQPRMGLLDPI